MCSWDRVVLQSASSFRHPFWVADAVKSKKTTWSSEMATHCLTHFCFQRTPGLKKKVDRPASHTTWPILCYLLLPKCKSFCSVTSPQMFLHSIWAEPMRASPNWGLAPVFLYPTFVAKQLMIFKSAGCFASYECSQERSAEGRYGPVEDSCENLWSNLGQGVTSPCNQAWPSVGRTWKRRQTSLSCTVWLSVIITKFENEAQDVSVWFHLWRNADKTKWGKFPFLQQDVHPLVWSTVYWCCVTILQSCKCQTWMLNTRKNKGNGFPTHDFPPIMTQISGTECQERCRDPFFPVPAILWHVRASEWGRLCVRVRVCLRVTERLHDCEPGTAPLQDLLLMDWCALAKCSELLK